MLSREISFDWGGVLVSVQLAWLLLFAALLTACVVVPLWANRSPNHDGDYIDDRWGYGDVDDDTWGLPRP